MTRTVLWISLAINVVAVGAMVYHIRTLGGWSYLLDLRDQHRAHENLAPETAAYQAREGVFEHLPARKEAIVFVGDSLTAGCEWGEIFPGVLNRGIGGDTSVSLLKRLPPITRFQPKVIFLMIGSNDLFDLGISAQQSVSNIRTIIGEIHRSSPRTVIYLQSVLPGRVRRLNDAARSINDGLKSLADGNKVVYVDLYPAFLDGDLLSNEFTSDGRHLTGEGYVQWTRLIEPYVQRYVQHSVRAHAGVQ